MASPRRGGAHDVLVCSIMLPNGDFNIGKLSFNLNSDGRLQEKATLQIHLSDETLGKWYLFRSEHAQRLVGYLGKKIVLDSYDITHDAL